MVTNHHTITNEWLVERYLEHTETDREAAIAIVIAMNSVGGGHNIAEVILRVGPSCFDRSSVPTISQGDRELLLLLAAGKDPEEDSPDVLAKAKQGLCVATNNALADYYRASSAAPERIKCVVEPAIRAQSSDVDVVAELKAGRDIVAIIGTAVGKADVELFQEIAAGEVSIEPPKRRVISTRKRALVRRDKPSPYQRLSGGLLPQAGARRRARSRAVSKAEARKARRLRDQAANERWRAPNGLCQAGRNPGAGHGKWKGHRSPATFITG